MFCQSAVGEFYFFVKRLVFWEVNDDQLEVFLSEIEKRFLREHMVVQCHAGRTPVTAGEIHEHKLVVLGGLSLGDLEIVAPELLGARIGRGDFGSVLVCVLLYGY